MHVDLCAVRDLLALDREQDELKAEAGRLAAAVQAARRDLVAAQAARAAAQETREAAVTGERTLNRRLDDYTGKRDRTRQLIDAGQAPDYQAAQKQLEQCAAIVDDLELRLLEAMEAREAAEAAEAAAVAAVGRAEAAAVAARDAQAARRPEIETRYKALSPQRPGLLARLSHAEAHHYAILRKNETPVLVDIVDGSCVQCHVAPPPQTMIEVRQEKRIHTCRGCGCWFREVVETAADEDEAAEA